MKVYDFMKKGVALSLITILVMPFSACNKKIDNNSSNSVFDSTTNSVINGNSQISGLSGDSVQADSSKSESSVVSTSTNVLSTGSKSSSQGASSQVKNESEINMSKYIRNVAALSVSDYKNQMSNFKLTDPVNLKTYSDSEKEAQRKAASSLRSKLNVAIATSKEKFKADGGVYRFSGKALFDLTGVMNLYIDISGCTFILEGNAQFAVLQSCSNVIFQGKAMIDREGGYSTQFTVQSYNEASKKLTVKLLDGYSLCDQGYNGGQFQWFNQDGSMIQTCFIPYTRASYINEAEGVVCFEGVALNASMNDDKVLKTGQIGAVVSYGWARVIYANYCKDLQFLDLYNYGSGCLYLVTAHTGDLVVKRVYNVRMPGTNRLIAGSCGQLEFIDGTPAVENCIFGFCDDDSLDIMGHCGFLYKQENPTTIIVKGTSTSTPVNVGDTLKFFECDSYKLEYTAKAVKVEEISDSSFNDTVWRDLTSNYSFFVTLCKTPCVRVTLDKKVSVSKGDMVENMDSCRAFNAVIRNCYFHDMGCRVLVQGCKGLTMENNLIERSGLSAICLDCEQRDWGEGPNSYDVVIRNNTIRESNSSPYATHFVFVHSGAIAIGPFQWWHQGFTASTATNSFQNILIENNKIYDSNYSGILVKNSYNVTIKNNLIQNPVTKLAGPHSSTGVPLTNTPGEYCYHEAPDYGIYLYACEKITLSDNTFLNMGKYCLDKVRKPLCK